MKCGSTYVADVLRRYFGAALSNHDIRGYDFGAEQNLSDALTEQLRGTSFSINLHLRPYGLNVAALGREAIAVLVLWRNLADVIVSFDDHVHSESEINPVFFIADRPRYLAMRPAERYAYLIDSIVPWNLSFYLAWRRRNVVLHPYERMVASPAEFIFELVRRLGADPEAERLAPLIAPAAGVRFNVGRAGRSAELLSEENRRRLERIVLDHPQRHELEVLLWELPWAVPSLQPLGPWDGRVVRAENGQEYFVSRAVRYAVADRSWLESRAPSLGAHRPIPTEQLATLKEGARLV